ncbi:hypothetical protein ACFL0K_02835 [Patescibacteria group bacterium]
MKSSVFMLASAIAMLVMSSGATASTIGDHVWKSLGDHEGPGSVIVPGTLDHTGLVFNEEQSISKADTDGPANPDGLPVGNIVKIDTGTTDASTFAQATKEWSGLSASMTNPEDPGSVIVLAKTSIGISGGLDDVQLPINDG